MDGHVDRDGQVGSCWGCAGPVCTPGMEWGWGYDRQIGGRAGRQVAVASDRDRERERRKKHKVKIARGQHGTQGGEGLARGPRMRGAGEGHSHRQSHGGGQEGEREEQTKGWTVRKGRGEIH